MCHRGILVTGIVVIAAGLVAAAEKPNPPITSSSTSSISDEMIGRRFPPMRLTVAAEDPEYAYSEKLPVAVGGGLGEGAHHTYRFLIALRGPKGEELHYTRIGTCCSFKTPNSPFGEAPLEVYDIRYAEEEPRRVYLNWYDSNEPMIPVGLSAVKTGK